MSETVRATIYRKDYAPPPFLVDLVELHFELDSAQTLVRSQLHLRRNPQAAPGQPLALDGGKLELISLSIDGVVVDAACYRQDSEKLCIDSVPDSFCLQVETRIHPAGNTALEGLYQSGQMLCTQCEAQGFSRITYFPDRPDVMSRYQVTMTADRGLYPVLLSNGNPVAQGEAADGRHWVRWEDPFPKPCYLFALVAGDLAHVEDRFVTESGREILLRIYVEPGNTERCGHAMTSLKQAMRWDEETYGLEYDLDIFMIVATGSFNMGAMENKGLNIFNAKYILASPDTATDRDFEAVRDIIGHEYFHNWTGNRVTCRDWFQLSLKESLTVFREQQFSSAMSGSAISRIEQANLLRNHQFAEDAGPIAHPVRPESYMEVNNFYTLTVYEKGAEVIRMIHSLLGAEGFRRGMDLYFLRHDGQAVTIEDFVASMESATGRDLGQFRLWYSQAGTPTISAGGNFDSATGKYRLTLAQSCPPTPGQETKLPMHIPVSVVLFGIDGSPVPGTQRVLELREKSETFEFTGLATPPIPSLLRGFSAPIRLEYAYSEADLRQLMAAENDSFICWDAAQRLFLDALARGVACCQQGRQPVEETLLAEVLERLLMQPAPDMALLAELLQMPTESYVAEQMAVIDVDAVVTAHNHLQCSLASRLRERLLVVYRKLTDTAPYSFDPASVARRRLRNTCLYWLGSLDTPEIRQICLEQFRLADNMTDCMTALQALNQHPSAERAQAMNDFHRRWSQEPLVLDKWLALEASAPLTNAVERVQELLADPSFDRRNPNRIRALLGTFSQGNLRGFHRPDGLGYRLLADWILDLDGTNPQVAARLAAGLSRWGRYALEQGQGMRLQLERILMKPGLSPDVHEIVAKSLSPA